MAEPKWVTINGRHIPIYEDDFESKYKNINPGYKKDAGIFDKEGRNNNCVKCALAFEANMRGNDTEANPFEFGNPEDLNKSRSVEKAFGLRKGDIWEVGDTSTKGVIKNVTEFMEEFGPGSRAILQSWTASQKHAFNVINDNGRIIFVDPLSGVSDGGKKVLSGVKLNGLGLIRTDDREMSKEYSEWAYKSRK